MITDAWWLIWERRYNCFTLCADFSLWVTVNAGLRAAVKTPWASWHLFQRSVPSHYAEPPHSLLFELLLFANRSRPREISLHVSSLCAWIKQTRCKVVIIKRMCSKALVGGFLISLSIFAKQIHMSSEKGVNICQFLSSHIKNHIILMCRERNKEKQRKPKIKFTLCCCPLFVVVIFTVFIYILIACNFPLAPTKPESPPLWD